MFSLGLFGILLVAAVPLLAIYAVAGIALKTAVVAVNHSNAPVLFSASSGSVARISLFAWLASVALFAVCGALNHWLTQYSDNTILRLYPLLQQLASLVLFFWFLLHRVSARYGTQATTTRTRVFWSLAVSAAPTVLLVAAANVWHLSRGNS